MISSAWFVGLAILLFALGLLGFFLKRDLVMMLLAIEVMINAAGLVFLVLPRAGGFGDGQVIVLFIITVAAAEAAIGLAVILLVFRRKKKIGAEDFGSMKG